MRGIINNIINFYQMQAEALTILLANTLKALEQSEKEREADEQIQRIENFVKDLTMNLNNMFAKFHFLKERKNRRHEELTDRQVRAMTEFAVFVKTLTRNVSSLLDRFQESQTFEEKIDKEIKELEADIGRKLREFDKALDETKADLTPRLIKFARSITGGFAKIIRIQRIFLLEAKNRRSEELTIDTREDSPDGIQETSVDQLEDIFNWSSIESVGSDEKKSKCLMHLKA